MADSNQTTPALSAADIAFLHDRKNWDDGGPNLHLTMYDGPYLDPDSARSLICAIPHLIGPFAEPEDIPDRPGRFQARMACPSFPWWGHVVVCDPQGRVPPFGAYSYLSTSRVTELVITVRPPQVERACGFNTADYEPGWVTPPVVDFYRVLVELIRDIHKLYPFRFGRIFVEGDWWYDRTVEGITVDREVADAAGWKALYPHDRVAVLPFS